MFSLHTFTKAIAKRPARVALVHGEVGAARVLATKAFLASWDAPEWAVIRVDLTEMSFPELLALVREVPSSLRVVVIRTEDLDAPEWEQFAKPLKDRRLYDTKFLVISSQKDAGPDVMIRKAFPSTAKVANCGAPSLKQGIAWCESNGVPRFLARHLVEHVGEHFGHAIQFVQKMRYVPGAWERLTPEHIANLVPLPVGAGFADALTRSDKAQAHREAGGVAPGDMESVLRSLVRQIDWMSRLQRHALSHHNLRELSKESGVPTFFTVKWHREAATFDPATVARRLNAVSQASMAYRRGARQGVLESVVALW